MAIRDNDQRGLRDRATETTSWLPILIGVAVVVLLGWWLFTGMNGTEGTRTSTPANNQTDTNKRTNPATTPGTTKPQ